MRVRRLAGDGREPAAAPRDAGRGVRRRERAGRLATRASRRGGRTQGACPARARRAEAVGVHAGPVVRSDAYPRLLAAIDDPPPVLWMRGDGRRARPARRWRSSGRAPAHRMRWRWRSGWRAIWPRPASSSSAGWRGASTRPPTAARWHGGPDPRGARLGRRRHLSAGARGPRGPRSPRRGALVSELCAGDAAASPLLSRCATASSAACRGRSWWSKRRRRSGSLITARCALEQGRDVLAVPGGILSGRNRGGHALLRDGARIVESADDILDELGLRRRGATGRPGRTRRSRTLCSLP